MNNLLTTLVLVGAVLLLVLLTAASFFNLAAIYLLLLLGVLLLVLASLAQIVEFKEYERGVVFLLGKFQSVEGPGWVLLFKGIQSYVRVDLRIQTLDIAPQDVITRDNIKVNVNPVVYLYVTDPKKAVLAVQDYEYAIIQLMAAGIRNAVGRLFLEEVRGKTSEIANELQETLQDVVVEWGLTVTRVEIKSIVFPPDLLKAMERKREAIEYKMKIETEASARQAAIQILDKATSKMSESTLAYLYLDALKKISEGKSNKIIFPLELSRLASLLSGRLGARGSKTAPELGKLVEEFLESHEGKAAKKKRGKESVADDIDYVKRIEKEVAKVRALKPEDVMPKTPAALEEEAEAAKSESKEEEPVDAEDAGDSGEEARDAAKKFLKRVARRGKNKK